MAEATADGAAARRILVIDDDPETARLLESWFSQQSYEILAASDGTEGLRHARGAHPPELILLDIRMPDLDGIEVARRLKSDAATRTIPIVLLSACRDGTMKSKGFACGAEDYVTKPFEFLEIDARIRSVLQRRDLLLAMQSKMQSLASDKSRLEQMLMLDDKTGLFNFREFQRRLNAEWQRSERYGTVLSLVFLDLDHFKRINDTLGHQTGDRILAEFATLVAGGARANDIAARYGGEEFAIVLPHTDAAMAVRVAERIRSAVREFVFVEDERPTRITVSAGVATYPAPSIDSVDALLRVADRALYRAKDRGRDRVVHAMDPADESTGRAQTRTQPAPR